MVIIIQSYTLFGHHSGKKVQYVTAVIKPPRPIDQEYKDQPLALLSNYLNSSPKLTFSLRMILFSLAVRVPNNVLKKVIER